MAAAAPRGVEARSGARALGAAATVTPFPGHGGRGLAARSLALARSQRNGRFTIASAPLPRDLRGDLLAVADRIVDLDAASDHAGELLGAAVADVLELRHADVLNAW